MTLPLDLSRDGLMKPIRTVIAGLESAHALLRGELGSEWGERSAADYDRIVAAEEAAQQIAEAVQRLHAESTALATTIAQERTAHERAVQAVKGYRLASDANLPIVETAHVIPCPYCDGAFKGALAYAEYWGIVPGFPTIRNGGAAPYAYQLVPCIAWHEPCYQKSGSLGGKWLMLPTVARVTERAEKAEHLSGRLDSAVIAELDRTRSALRAAQERIAMLEAAQVKAANHLAEVFAHADRKEPPDATD